MRPEDDQPRMESLNRKEAVMNVVCKQSLGKWKLDKHYHNEACKVDAIFSSEQIVREHYTYIHIHALECC